jgi:2-polyprenyl-3-methyl-5-hydroxy-6-metoxy-1,4-benzoquinol methylase
MPETAQGEIRTGERFRFGENWQRFLAGLSPERLQNAERSLLEKLELPNLERKRFLDAGSGSGLFSLAARKLGATVVSFDYDPDSAACTEALKARYLPGDPRWTICEGSLLDADWLATLGQFDIVYSWGVLHHTGDMWRALGNVAPLVRPGGKLFISIYNDQGTASRRWKKLKQLYNSGPAVIRIPILVGVLWHVWWRSFVKDSLRGRPLFSWRRYSADRGMSPWRDVVDWAGGYPFEVAKPEELFDFYRKRGFTLTSLATCGGTLGCNQFVFQAVSEAQAAYPNGRAEAEIVADHVH